MPKKQIKRKIVEPKFTGIKKGYDAIFLGDDISQYVSSRIRRLTPNGVWHWDYADAFRKFTPEIPCWLPRVKTSVQEQIKAMKQYDRLDNRETVFLGYVKDVE